MRRIDVPRKPTPQGSLRPIVSASTGRTFIKQDEKVLSYRARVMDAWGDSPWVVESDPILVHATFVFRRPDNHFMAASKKRPKRAVMRPNAPIYHTQKPDIDKLLRATLDALTGLAYIDDKQVTQLHAAKEWGDRDHTIIEVMTIEEHDAEV